MPRAAKKRGRSAGSVGGEQVLEGLGVSPGVAIGRAHLREGQALQIRERRIAKGEIQAELRRFRDALEKAERQIDKLAKRAHSYHGAAAEELGYLLDAHKQMLSSRRLQAGVEARISADRSNAEAAVMAEIGVIAGAFAGMDDAYLAARATEIEDVGERLVRNMSDEGFVAFKQLEAGSVILAESISPADTALMDPKLVGGFACVLGGAEGHTAIMARSLGLPAVMGVAELLERVTPGAPIIVDGSQGLVIVDPSPKRVALYKDRLRDLAREERQLARLRNVAAISRDGVTIRLEANIELPIEAALAVQQGAEGVGLLRSEFLFMNREDLPDTEEQYEALKAVVETMDGRPVTVRTLDVGGEKLAPGVAASMTQGANPALGLRAIRLSLQQPELLENQLAAMLRAAALGPLRILLPMITSVSEVRAVRERLVKVARRLKRRGEALPHRLPPLGVMIEVPGAALAADALAQVADFFAIGTNDLTQYTLAIDRSEEQVAHLYNPLHPAVLRLIQFSVEAALRARIPVSVCGETAGDPRLAPLLLGLGVRELSMTANAIPRIKSRILSIDVTAATRRAAMIMDQVDPGRIAALIDDFNDTA